MRGIDETTRTALEGSRQADTLTVWAWRGGDLVVPEPLKIISWSAEDDAGESVKIGQRLSLTIADTDGTLGAWKLDDPLGVAGSRLQVVYRVGGAGAINFGWFRVVSNEPDEMVDSRIVREYGYAAPDSPLEPHTIQKFVTTAVVKIEAVDLTIDADNDRFEAPESPRPGSTAITEFARLTARHFPTVVDPGVTDMPVSTLLVFDRERLEEGQDLLASVSARYRMGGDGECHVYPVTGEPVWRVAPGFGLVKVSRRQSSDRLYNRWIVEGKDEATGDPVRAVASVEAGPLRYDGPHGRVPFFYTSEMITSSTQAAEYAGKLRAKFLDSLAVELVVDTIPWPQGQSGDHIEVACPLPAGHVAYFRGAVQSIRRAGAKVPTETTITVSCAYTDVEAALGSTEWAKHITAGKPPLTWDRMPGSWGQIPAITWDNPQ